MAIYNLGQFGAPRASTLSGMSKALSETTTNFAAIATQKQKNQIELAKYEGETEEKNRKHGMKVIEDYSMYLGDKDPNEQEMFWQTDQGKQIAKLVKSTHPEYMSDKGIPVVVPREEIYKTHLEKRKTEILMKQSQGGEITQNEVKYLEALKSAGPDAITQVMKILTSGTMGAQFQMLLQRNDPQSKAKLNAMMTNALRNFKQFGGRMGVQETGGFADQLNQPQGDPDDPLGLRR